MKIQKYPHLSPSTQVNTAILLPITLVSEFLTIFSASSSTINRIISQKIRKRRIEEESKEVTQDHIGSL